MRSFQTTRLIEWGDCDAAGIVFYPNYFRWMDSVCHELFKSLGFEQKRLETEYELLGAPLIDVGCKFVAPATYGDELTIHLTVSAMTENSLALQYKFEREGADIATGREARVFACHSESGIRKSSIPDQLRAALNEYRSGE